MLDNLAVVLFSPKFSENVGSAARACANMGVSRLILVSPRDFDMDRARTLATTKGVEVLSRMEVYENLAEALTPFSAVYGTTARTGGWRKGMLTPESAAPLICESLGAGGKAAVIFGPEEAGLTNQETQICGRLMTIPTNEDASSLNLAQAVLLVLYEVFKQSLKKPFEPAGPKPSRAATHAEREALFENLREALLTIDFLKDDNPDYWMLPMRRFVERIGLRRNEFNLVMGVCRQIRWACGRGENQSSVKADK